MEVGEKYAVYSANGIPQASQVPRTVGACIDDK
jgi:hypothetical protein